MRQENLKLGPRHSHWFFVFFERGIESKDFKELLIWGDTDGK
jgi:hypothetical protein